MARFSADNVALAGEIIARYPRPRSALIPLLHLAQEQDGWVTEDAMGHIAELVDVTPAEVLGTCSFYEMFKLHPVGRYLVNVCTNISCLLVGGEELLQHAEERLGIRAGATTADGVFTLEDVECLAACTEAPCLQVNYRYFHRISNDGFDRLVDDLRAGRRADEIPPHGVLARTRQIVADDRRVGAVVPEHRQPPSWFTSGKPALVPDSDAEPEVVVPVGAAPPEAEPGEPGDEAAPVAGAVAEARPDVGTSRRQRRRGGGGGRP